MKKNILMVLLTLTIPIIALSQTTDLDVMLGAGVSVFNADTKESYSAGISFSFAISGFYIDLASNFASGDGEELEFSSSQTYDSDKLLASVINFGYMIPLGNFRITPVIGYGWTKEIFQDPVGWDTYYYGDSEGRFNIGVKGMILFDEKVGLYFGVGCYERISGGLSLYF